MQKVVVVTGASTGIGFDCVRKLIQSGFVVVATVRKQTDRENLEKNFGEKVKVLIVDLVNLSSIENLPSQMKSQYKIQEIFGLVNNAGVANAAPFQHQNFSEIETCINLNVLALMKVTQVFLPFLQKGGRIVNMSSVAGTGGLPFLSVYAASKHAVEGFSQGLRRELRIREIFVSVVGPGTIKTPIWQKGFEPVKNKFDNTVYGKAFNKFLHLALSGEKKGLEPSEVSNCVYDALTSADPKYRYAPIPNKFANWYLPKILPGRFYDFLIAKTLGLLPRP